MSLVSEINRTETEKNKTKTVATNIDNKLVELGGEQAIDLADVPNKIQKMIGQYNKVATGTARLNRYSDTVIFSHTEYSSNIYKLEKPIKVQMNLNFEPKIVYAYFKSITLTYSVGRTPTMLCNKHHFSSGANENENNVIVNTMASSYTLFFESLSKREFAINIESLEKNFRNIYVEDCEWIALA